MPDSDVPETGPGSLVNSRAILVDTTRDGTRAASGPARALVSTRRTEISLLNRPSSRWCRASRPAQLQVVGLVVCAQFWGGALAGAAGTPAGTLIENRATATFTVGTTPVTANSNTVTTTVAERIELELTWIDAAPVPVEPGDANQVTTFLLANQGNGSETFALTGTSALGGDDFDPSWVGIHLDTDMNGVFDATIDAQYVAGVNDPVLPPDGSLVVFVLNDMPAGLSDGDEGLTELTATSTTGSGASGTLFPGAGDGGVDAVVGTSGGQRSASGSYVVSAVTVSVVKSAVVVDPFGDASPIPGATITYSIAVEAAGSGSATNVVVRDPIPPGTRYNAGTLALDGTSLSDAVDADAGEMTGGAVTVRLGDVAAASPIQTVSFQVTIDPN